MKKKLSLIIVPEGRRNIDDAKVSELAESIKVVGLLNGGYIVLAPSVHPDGMGNGATIQRIL